jgi:23S rRNA (cytidine1920-2'-O)/16S rRNA (cytidine1409-2'-O)-methyltransferase
VRCMAQDPTFTPAGRGQRLDVALVDRGLVRSRAQARDLIRRGLVRVSGAQVLKPAALVDDTVALEVYGAAAGFVSRGGEKLEAALAAFGFDARGRTALDVGASTGGFTQVLLARGAAHVFAVDVGHGQLHPALLEDRRVTSLEGYDVRALTRAEIPAPVSAIVADVSFISLAKALPAALALAAPGAWVAALVKPQFELGPEAVGKGGIVRDGDAQAAAVAGVRGFFSQMPGWQVVGVIASPIEGGSGNREYLIGASHAVSHAASHAE